MPPHRQPICYHGGMDVLPPPHRSFSSVGRLAGLFLCLWTFACCSDDPPATKPDAGTDPDGYSNYLQPRTVWVGGSLDNGTGFVDWSLPSGVDLPKSATIISGPQGGQHIWVTVRTKGLAPKKAKVKVEIVQAGACEEFELECQRCETSANKNNADCQACAKDTFKCAVAKPGYVEIIGSLKVDPAAPEWLYYQGIAAFIKEPCKIMKIPHRVQVQIVDLYGDKAAAEARIVPTWDGWCLTPP